MRIQAGQLGKYELRERLGEGGMAEVWKAFDARLQRYVAIKFMHSMLRGDPTFVSRFLREAQAVASLHHPNIVQIYDFESSDSGSDDAPAYMVMDYIEGQTLAAYLHATVYQGRFLPGAELLTLFYAIGSAIDYAHQRGLLHRDIKPANILLDRRNTTRNPMGEPILTDFGIVKIMGAAAGTLTSSSMGTPLYISPEQARGQADTTASDLYSLGVVLYEVCAGRPPFQGDSPFAILQQHITTPPPPPEQFNPAITPAVSAVILRSLAKNPQDRYPNALAMVSELAVALGLTPPDRREFPLSSPDIRQPVDSATQVATIPTHVLRPATPPPAAPLTPPPPVIEPGQPSPTTFAGQAPTVRSERAAWLPLTPTVAPAPVPQQRSPASAQPAADQKTYTPTPPPTGPREQPAPARKPRGWRIGLIAALIVILASAGFAAFHFFTNQSTGPMLVGTAFFNSSGAANGAQNLGINDEFQIRLTSVPPPATGKLYYAWLLPDVNQPESSPLALGPLHLNGGIATLPTTYINPQHTNLVGQFSRFLVTEEDSNPAPRNPSLNKAQWRYYGEIPQTAPSPNCQGPINQLSVLCHLRHLLSGDPDLAKVNLQGGLNYWTLNNVKELQKWAQESVDHGIATDVRHKIVNILYVLNGRNCIQQSLQHAAPGADNTIDDGTLPTIAAIPLMDCSLTPDLPGYISHIHNHLNAILQSPSVTGAQTVLGQQIGTELNTIDAWLQTIQNDAVKLVALSDAQLTQPGALDMRRELATLATQVLSGGTNPGTGALEKGMQGISLQIQQMATINVTSYQAH